MSCVAGSSPALGSKGKSEGKEKSQFAAEAFLFFQETI